MCEHDKAICYSLSKKNSLICICEIVYMMQNKQVFGQHLYSMFCTFCLASFENVAIFYVHVSFARLECTMFIQARANLFIVEQKKKYIYFAYILILTTKV